MLWMLGGCREPVPVTKDNFARAESQWHFARFVERGALGHFYHFRRLGITDQPGMRPNTDAYHSVAVFDLDAGPVTITLPEAGERFESMSIINEDNLVVGTDYTPGPHVYSKVQAGSRYVIAIVRFFTDGDVSLDSQIVHGLQDELVVQQAGPGQFDMPTYDAESQQAVRHGLRALAGSLTNWRRAAGSKQEVDPQQHLAATAADWGLPDEDDAQYFTGSAATNDGSGVFQLVLREVPADGFWSVSVCDSTGHVPQGAYDQFTINNTTAHSGPDGGIVIQFGGCDSGVDNCLPIFPGWRYTVRLYRPRPTVLDSTWTMPRLQWLR
ncbi:DUF1254 domain-containing protein [Paraflavitalea pollutisoli]|uniref:DUF1254 domain-containing protein n=1 Tax=Paraflavitalea pollutisoli TaxID=3034143 RepID=UPI0023EC2737|nr:DUF1254 domain-containing protein [Paraflavitalea sp. H1-2-19X]